MEWENSEFDYDLTQGVTFGDLLMPKGLATLRKPAPDERGAKNWIDVAHLRDEINGLLEEILPTYQTVSTERRDFPVSTWFNFSGIKAILNYLVPALLCGKYDGHLTLRCMPRDPVDILPANGEFSDKIISVSLYQRQESPSRPSVLSKHITRPDMRAELSEIAEEIERAGGVLVTRVDDSHRLSFHVIFPITA